ncbi:MAG TPA: UDP-N-acetylmuramate dehydrogenase [Symbiobacteriaceae bacterium]|nr:UDP-N-acetylmuramate dehydrogenase [Symbiobacteriaceae bacterium]
MSPIAAKLRTIISDPGRIRPDEPLHSYTTFRIGGPADWLVEVTSGEELAGLLQLAKEESLPVHVLGNGSNLLVSDTGVRGFVIILAGEFNRYELTGQTLRAGGGYNLPKLANRIAKLGLGGLEFACAIPGTVGAGLVINAGAHGGELKDVVSETTVVWLDGRKEVLPVDRIGLRYRSSDLQGAGAIVTEVVMQLRTAVQEELMAHMKAHLERRRQTQPLNLPNAGSVFMNPPGDFAGRLIEQAGLKGLTVGGAQVSEKHANFVVNLGNATAKDVLLLMDRVRAEVDARFGVRLQPEVKIWGDNPYFIF